MSYDEIQRLTEIERITNEKPRYLDMDEAFCARMHAAIAAGLESAPIGVITTPGTKKPKYVSELTARYHRPRNERRPKVSGIACHSVRGHHFIIGATQFGPVSRF